MDRIGPGWGPTGVSVCQAAGEIGVTSHMTLDPIPLKNGNPIDMALLPTLLSLNIYLIQQHSLEAGPRQSPRRKKAVRCNVWVVCTICLSGQCHNYQTPKHVQARRHRCLWLNGAGHLCAWPLTRWPHAKDKLSLAHSLRDVRLRQAISTNQPSIRALSVF